MEREEIGARSALSQTGKKTATSLSLIGLERSIFLNSVAHTMKLAIDLDLSLPSIRESSMRLKIKSLVKLQLLMNSSRRFKL
jgi:hypothetical protein